MHQDIAVYLSQQLLWNALLISSPVVLATMLCGLVVSVLQAATQLQDSTLSAIPKLLVAMLMLLGCGHWMLRTLIDFSKHILHNIPEALA